MSSTETTTGLVRISYAHLFTPKAINAGDKPKYSVQLLIPKTDKTTIKAIRSAIAEAQSVGASILSGVKESKLRMPLRDGDDDDDNSDEREELYGHFFINANSDTKPSILDIDNQEVEDKTEVYSGCYCKVLINFFAYNPKLKNIAGSPGIGCGLRAVKKIKDGDPFGSHMTAAKAAEMFGEDDPDDYEDDDFTPARKKRPATKSKGHDPMFD